MSKATVVTLAIFVIIGVSLWVTNGDQKDTESMVNESPISSTLTPTQTNMTKTYTSAPEMKLEKEVSYEAVIKTNKGDMRFKLFSEEAPLTVNNFVFLSEEGFYNDTVFHRVIEDFMAQGGDPTGTGMGGPGYSFKDEFESDKTFDKRGILAMANSGPNTNGSQFFITFEPTEWLTGKHTIFGELIEGDEALSNIAIREPGSPIPPDVIKEIEIIKK